MGSSNPSRFLADTSGDFGLSLKRYWGNVVEAYRDEVILFNPTAPSIAVKTVDAGKEHQFLMMADTPEAENHTPGQELLGQQYEVQDGSITVDDILVAHHDIPLDQYLLSHFEVAPQLGVKDGQKLAREYDQRLMNLAVLAARTAGVTKNGLTVHNGGNRIKDVAADVATKYPVTAAGAQAFRANAAYAAQLMDEDNTPEEGRTMYITPYIRRVLGMDPTIFDVRYTPGTPNSLNKRAIGELEGFTVVVAKNRIPTTNVVKYTGTLTKYNGDFRCAGTGEPVAVILCGARQGQAALGLVKVAGPTSIMQADERRNTMFIKSQMLMGAGKLHVWNAATIEVATA